MDAVTGRRLDTLAHADRVASVRFSPDGRSVLTASWDGSAYAWSVPTRQEQIELARSDVPRCLESRVRTAAFLAPAPPLWCVDMGKWPFNDRKWKDWASAMRAGKPASLPR